MKKLHIGLFLSLVFLVSFTLRMTSNVSCDKVRIVLDAGHGGKDQGAEVNGVFEAELNLKVTLKLKDILEYYGVDVILTRSGNYDLSTDENNRKRTDAKARVRLANNSNADLFISIHMNKFPKSKYKGAQTFFNSNRAVNKLIASSIQNEFIRNLNSPRKIQEIRNVFIIDNVRIPAVLVEGGFMSNPEELILLQQEEHQLLIAQAIFNGISNYLILF